MSVTYRNTFLTFSAPPGKSKVARALSVPLSKAHGTVPFSLKRLNKVWLGQESTESTRASSEQAEESRSRGCGSGNQAGADGQMAATPSKAKASHPQTPQADAAPKLARALQRNDISVNVHCENIHTPLLVTPQHNQTLGPQVPQVLHTPTATPTQAPQGMPHTVSHPLPGQQPEWLTPQAWGHHNVKPMTEMWAEYPMDCEFWPAEEYAMWELPEQTQSWGDMSQCFREAPGRSPPGPIAGDTTLMLRNIPNRYSQDQLIDEVNSIGFEGTYDFLYLPIDAKKSTNVGYAFINFIDPADATQMTRVFTDYRFTKFASAKIGKVSRAHIQGLYANLAQIKGKKAETPWVNNLELLHFLGPNSPAWNDNHVNHHRTFRASWNYGNDEASVATHNSRRGRGGGSRRETV